MKRLRRKTPSALYQRISRILESACSGVARSVNTTQVIANSLQSRIDQKLGIKPMESSKPLDVASVFGKDGVCVQRYYFYYDDDGAESFDVFRRTYSGDPAWKITDHRGWVHIVSKPVDGRRIEIFANEPFDLLKGANVGREDEALRRQTAVTKALSDRQLTPVVVVHRGHAYHTPKTVDQVSSAARLVFLGSCRGMDSVYTVIETADSAQLIATRAVGTSSINDPILKAINDRLLRGEAELDWSTFWREQELRLGRNAQFQDYVPPDKNATAIFLGAYYNYSETN